MSGGSIEKADFVVVGAGLAGLRAAAELSKAGASVVVFEARERVGGRVLTIPLAEGSERGLPLDMGAQWIGPGQRLITKLVADLGLHREPTHTKGKTIWALEKGIRRGRMWLPPLPPGALAELIYGGIQLLRMSRKIPLEGPWDARQGMAWDAMSVQDWASTHLSTGAARNVLELLVSGNSSASIGEISLLGLLFDWRSTGGLRNLASAEAFRIKEGAQEIAVRMSRPLGGSLQLGDPVQRISQDEGGVTVASCERVVRCAGVAVCVPPPLVNEITFEPDLPSLQGDLFKALPMGSSIKFHAIYDKPFWRALQLSGAAFSTRHAVCLTYDNTPPIEDPPGALVGLVVADQAKRLHGLDQGLQREEIIGSLVEFFGPGAGNPETLLIYDWSSDEWAGGCYSAYFAPKVWTTLGRGIREPAGRVHWAGTETATRWYGYMEGALLSGVRVAAELLETDSSHRSAGIT